MKGKKSAIDLTNPQTLRVLWAAMVAMTHDIHSPQDNLSDADWKHGEELSRVLDDKINAGASS